LFDDKIVAQLRIPLVGLERRSSSGEILDLAQKQHKESGKKEKRGITMIPRLFPLRLN